jgi:phage-related baseplate assembly protein
VDDVDDAALVVVVEALLGCPGDEHAASRTPAAMSRAQAPRRRVHLGGVALSTALSIACPG